MANKKKGEGTTSTSNDDGSPKGGVPLFPEVGTEWSYLDVSRIEPADEVGFLGRLDLHATEEQIKGRWGGGKFTLRAKNDKHQVCGNRTVDVAGDPIFISDTARDRWLRGQGRASEIPAKPGQPAGAPAAAPQSFGVAEIVSLFQGMQAMSSAQQQAWAQQQAEERRAREADDRRREDERRADDRRREDQRREEERQREERRAAEEERSRQRDREFMTTMINVVSSSKPAGEPATMMQAFTSGISLALKMAGGGSKRSDDDDDDEEEDPISETVRGAVRGLGDALAGRFAPGGAATPPATSAAAPPATAPGEPEPVILRGPLAAQVGDFVRKAQAAGKNPEALIAGGIDVLAKKLPGAPAPTNGATQVAAAINAVKASEGKAPPTSS